MEYITKVRVLDFCKLLIYLVGRLEQSVPTKIQKEKTMNKNLFKQILKQTISRIEESFDNVEFEKIDTSKFRYKNDESYKIFVDGEFSLQIDYNQSNEDGSMKSVSDRSVSFYLTRYQDTNYHAGRDSIYRTIHAYKSDSWRTYDTTMMISVYVKYE